MAWNHRDRAASAQWLTISANTKRNNMLIDGQRLPVSSPQIREQRQGVCGKPLDLGGALFMRTEQVDDDGARPCGVERADPIRYLRLCAERCVAPRGLTKIHRVPDAQRLGRGIECLLVAVVEPREQQIAGAKPSQSSPSRSGGERDLGQVGRVYFRGHDIREPSVR